MTIARDGKPFAVSHTSGRIYLFNITGTQPFSILDDDDLEDEEMEDEEEKMAEK